MKIRNFKPKDSIPVINLWKKAKIFYSPSDKKENLIKKHQKEPELFLVAEENHQIMGVVLGQYDGWGAYTHHLATTDNYGKIAELLILEIEKRLKQKGAKTIFLFTFPHSKESQFVKKQKYKYWGLSAGWEKRIK